MIQVAAGLLDEAGGVEVTLGEIAAKLGVRTPSLYNHIDGMDDLRRGLALLGVRELGDRVAHAAIGKAGDDAMVAIGHAYRDFAQERPGLYRWSLRAPEPSDHALIEASDEILNVLRLVLEPYGLSEEEEVHAMRGLRSLMHGFVSLEIAGGFGMPIDLDQSYRRLLMLFISGLRQESPISVLGDRRNSMDGQPDAEFQAPTARSSESARRRGSPLPRRSG